MTAPVTPKKGPSIDNLFNSATIKADARDKDANAVAKDVVRGLQLSEYYAAQSPAKFQEAAKALVAEILPNVEYNPDSLKATGAPALSRAEAAGLISARHTDGSELLLTQVQKAIRGEKVSAEAFYLRNPLGEALDKLKAEEQGGDPAAKTPKYDAILAAMDTKKPAEATADAKLPAAAGSTQAPSGDGKVPLTDAQAQAAIAKASAGFPKGHHYAYDIASVLGKKIDGFNLNENPSAKQFTAFAYAYNKS